MQRALLDLLAATAALSALLAVLAVGGRLRRDRGEARRLARRAELAELLFAGSAGALASRLRRLARDPRAQADLAVVLRNARPPLQPARREALERAVAAARLERALRRRLRRRDPVARAAAALLVSRLRLADAPRMLGPLLRDPDGDVRLVAVRAIAELADPAAALLLIRALAAGALAPERLIERLGGDWAVDTVLLVLDEIGAGRQPGAGGGATRIAQRPIRAWLARALGLAGSARAEPSLRALLREGDAEERVSAARALGGAGRGAEAAAALREALSDPEWRVRAQAAGSLGSLGAVAAVPALAGLLDDPAWWVRAGAADALRRLGPAGLEALRAALRHPDRYARDRAREALALEGLAAVRR